jgi:phosphohistidine phosphatase
MLITFLRHATAEQGTSEISDADRRLTAKGKSQIKRVADFCHTNRLIPSQLYCSPLLRAQQTAKILQQRLPGAAPRTIASWLDLDTPVAIMVQELANLTEQNMEDVWIVGHEPLFSDVIGHFLHNEGTCISIKTASLIRLDVAFTPVVTATLLWSIPCSMMPFK